MVGVRNDLSRLRIVGRTATDTLCISATHTGSFFDGIIVCDIHSEINGKTDEPLQFLLIHRGPDPGHESAADAKSTWVVVLSSGDEAA
jgi:hypothetical protein